jgi:hypothetical protein
MRNLVNILNGKIQSKSKFVVAVCVMASSCGWHIADAQVVKGSAASDTKLTAAQVYDHLRAAHSPGRTTAKIATPRAGQFDNSAKLAICRTQKQNADREVQDIIPTLRAMGDGSVKQGSQQLTITGKQASNPQGLTITGNQPGGAPGTQQGAQQLTITGAQPGRATGKKDQSTGTHDVAVMKGAAGQAAVSGNGAPQTDMRKAGGDPGAKVVGNVGAGGPQGPMKTENSSSPQTPGSASSAAVAGVSCPTPMIKSISGFPMAIFTPGTLFGPYSIKGCGFGWQTGNVYLTGAFNAGKIPLVVQTSGEGTGGGKKAPLRASWTDTMIVVSVDPNLTGELDQTNVTLVVEPVGGSPITKPGNDFLAPREVVELATIPQSKVQFTQLPPSSKGSPTTAPSAVYGANPAGFALNYHTPSNLPTGMSAEVFRGGTTVFFPDGYDVYDLHTLASGFFIDSFQLHYDPDPTPCDADTAGSRGSWSATFDSLTSIRVSWKEVRCHQAWMGTSPDVWSQYALNVFVKGPRGIDPWTGKRLLSGIVPAAVQRITK